MTEEKVQLSKVKVSNKTVIPTKHEVDEQKIKAADWFNTAYPNIFLLAPKHSGKTTCIANIIRRKKGKYTKFLLFSSTIKKDKEWISIVKKLESDDHEVIAEDNFVIDGEDLLESFMNENKEEPEQEVKKKRTTQEVVINPSGGLTIKTVFHNEKPEMELTDKDKIKKSKLLYPEWICVIDDLPTELRKSKSLEKLIKTNRHYRMLLIISSQSLVDLDPSKQTNMDYILAFGKIPDDKINVLYERVVPPISEDTFYNLYKDATSKKYNFLFIDCKNNTFRSGFTDQYLV